MALTMVAVHGQILSPDGLIPAVGYVRFSNLIELRDTVANIIYSPDEWVGVLDLNGEFTITIPATDNPDVTPLNWSYQVWVQTDVWREQFFTEAPFTIGTIELSDLIGVQTGNGSDCTPDGTACAPISIVADLADFQAQLDALDLAKVNRSGDTMTGSLIIAGSADLTVGGTTTTSYAGITGDITEFASTVLGTGVISGGVFSVNAGDPTKLDISAMIGYIVDYDSSAPITATNPSLIKITLAAQVALALTGPPAQTTTWWMVDSAATIIQQAPRPTATQRRTHIVLGATAQFGGVIAVDQTLPVILSQLPNQLVDLLDGLGPYSTSGNVISANGVNLTINKTAGTMFVRAFSQVPTYQDPHSVTLPAQTPVTCRRATATAVLAPLQTLIDVANYDPGGLGVIAPVGGGAFTSTNFRLWGFGTNLTTDNMAVQYGQNTYSSLANAVAGIGSGNYIPNPLFVDGTLLGWLSVIRTAADLSNVTQATFTKAPKFATP